MKKVSRVAALVLALVMAVSLCGCGNDSGKDLVGTWGIDYDLSSLIAGELGEEFADFNAPLKMTICFEFKEDKTYAMYGEPVSFKANFEGWLEEFLTFGTNVLYKTFEAQGMNEEEAEAAFQEQFGSSISDYMRQTFEEELDMDALLDEMSTTGKYDTSGNKLYMAQNGEEIDKNAYDVFTVSGDTLKLELPDGADASEAEVLPNLTYPLEFKKMN